MANTTVDIEIVFDRFPELAGQMRQRAGQIVRKTAFDIKSDYQQTARRDTGAQVNSAYVVTANTSGYSQAASDALAADPTVDLLPPVPQPDPYTAIVAVGVAHGALNEYGGETGPDGLQRRAGDAALTKATEKHRPGFLGAMSKLLE